MSQEGYADPVMNDGPRFHSIIPVSELTERCRLSPSDQDRRQDSAPLVVRNRGWGNAHNSQSTPTKAQQGSGAQDKRQGL